MTGRTASGTPGGPGTGAGTATGGPGDGRAEDVVEGARLIADLARATPGSPADLRRLAGLLGDRFGPGSRLLCRAADLALLDAVADPTARGWTARDLVEVVRRRVGTSAVPLVLDVVAGEAAQRPGGGSPEEVAALAALDAEVWWDRGHPLVEQWSSTRGLPAPAALRAALGIVHTLCVLPTLPRSRGDGADGADGAAAPPGVDARVLARVRALLAKAESTTFAEEAEALSAKAQELMGRHALEAAVVGSGAASSATEGAATRRIWLDAPYASAKAHLVHRVASPNRCRAVTLDALDMVTVIGHPVDLGTVELLVTSLLVQADRAMLAAPEAGVGRDGLGRSRTRSFRHAFLLSYATRIGERLATASHEAQVRARAEVGESLLPVLAARAEVVDAAVGELFPRITTRRASVGNREGWFAGRAAAEAASLSPGRHTLDRHAAT